MESLEDVRDGIDKIDQRIMELLAQRMRLSRKIVSHKMEQGLTIQQMMRYAEIVQVRSNWGAALGLNEEFVKALFQAVHEESVRVQVEVMNERVVPTIRCPENQGSKNLS